MSDLDTNIAFQPFPNSPHFLDLTGQIFGRLSVLGYMGKRGKRLHNSWLCQCSCGRQKVVDVAKLRNGSTQGCGPSCPNRPRGASLKHGMSNSRIYSIWQGMKWRCCNTNAAAFRHYGGRGIAVCDRWLVFENFLADMGEPPPGKTLERKDNDGDYRPENCTWATACEQANNRRRTIKFTYNGKTQSIKAWCRELDRPYKLVITRIELGWSIEDAMFKPKMSFSEFQKLGPLAMKAKAERR